MCSYVYFDRPRPRGAHHRREAVGRISSRGRSQGSPWKAGIIDWKRTNFTFSVRGVWKSQFVDVIAIPELHRSKQCSVSLNIKFAFYAKVWNRISSGWRNNCSPIYVVNHAVRYILGTVCPSAGVNFCFSWIDHILYMYGICKNKQMTLNTGAGHHKHAACTAHCLHEQCCLHPRALDRTTRSPSPCVYNFINAAWIGLIHG